MMSRVKKLPPRRGRAKQRVGVDELRKRLKHGPLLDSDSTERLMIDDFANRYTKGRKTFLRAEVERLARIAITRTLQDIERAPHAREKARELLETLTKIVSKARSLVSDRFDVIDAAYGFQLKDAAGQYMSATTPLSQIVDGLKSVCEWQGVLKDKFEIKPPPSRSRNEVLALHFLKLMADFHSLRTGKSVPKSRGGPFVYFVQNAWVDLNFPDLPERTLAQLAERYRN